MKGTFATGRSGRLALPVGLLGALGMLGLLSATTIRSSDPGEPHATANRYIGSSKCKNCHKSEASGDQYGAWSDAKHSHAYEGLATEEAKKLAAEMGIGDPQQADECLRCHTTTHGVDEELVKRGFKIEEGVGCETCHGPGEQHMKARLAAAANAAEDEGFGDEAPALVELPDGEILASPPESRCLDCHNDSAPNFKGFCYREFVAKVSHWDPRKERPAREEVACHCGHPEGHVCTDACAEEGD